MATGIHLAAGILAALMQRERTGHGQKVEVAMHDTCIPALTSLIAPVLDGQKLSRLGNRRRGVCPCNVYPTGDGGEVMIMCVSEPHWRAMLKLLAREELASDPRFKNVIARLKVVEEVDSMVCAWSKTQTRDTAIRAMMERGIPCSPVRTVAEVLADPEIAQQAMLRPSRLSDSRKDRAPRFPNQALRGTRRSPSIELSSRARRKYRQRPRVSRYRGWGTSTTARTGRDLKREFALW